MKTTPAAVVQVHDGVCSLKKDNGCKRLGNDNEISALSLLENSCIFVPFLLSVVRLRKKDLPLGRLKSLSPQTKLMKLLSRQLLIGF